MIDTAIILAAGRGQRLDPLTRNRPKALAPFFGVPLLEHTLRHLAAAGIRKVFVNAHYRSRDLVAHARSRVAGSIDLQVVVEERLLGTGGALANLRRFVSGSALVVNGDNLLRIDIPALLRAHEEHAGALTLGVLPVVSGRAGHLVETDGDHGLRGLRRVRGKAAVPGNVHCHFNAGVLVARRDLLDELEERPHGLEDEALPRLLGRGGKQLPLRVVALDGVVEDLGTPPAFVRSHVEALHCAERVDEIRRTVEVVEGTKGRLFWDGERRVAWLRSPEDLSLPEVSVQECFLGRGTRLMEGVELSRSVVLDGAWVGEGAVITDCLIGPGSQVEAGARLRGQCVPAAGFLGQTTPAGPLSGEEVHAG